MLPAEASLGGEKNFFEILKKALTSGILYHIIIERAVIAQEVEHFLGKEEVTSSSLVNSSKNKSTALRCFYFWILRALQKKDLLGRKNTLAS